ncbi:nucleotide-diphospho-sugar transferase [Amylostereum chailletii]|nr:nucleotide-diphospho-sugar transferase [Amylostereum chailletii]
MSLLPFRRRTVHIFLFILGLFLLGTVIVLSTVSYYLSIPDSAYILQDQLDSTFDLSSWNATEHKVVHRKEERIPRILHQTWKSETLPQRWKEVAQGCRELMPDYEYMLWTDASSRDFIAKEYPWFLDTFDSYPYPIQRADAIRYFILHHYGGVYLDLDIGCLRRVDPLLVYPVILPRTIPVGVSNDLMFAEKGHPFMAQTIHNLVTFNHDWILNYPTVMFSTGPMFLSAQFGLYSASHPGTPDDPAGEVRILPKSLYGKNAKPSEAPNPFFEHFYGSSWHSDDAAFIAFLGHWGKALMWLGLALLVVSMIKLGYTSGKQRRYIGNYDVMLPRWVERNNRWHLDLGWMSLPGRLTPSSSPIFPERVPSSYLNRSGSSSSDEDELSMLPLSLRVGSPSASEMSFSEEDLTPPHTAIGTARRVRDSIMSWFTPAATPEHRRRSSRGVVLFVPAIAQGASTPSDVDRSSTLARTSSYPPEKGGQTSSHGRRASQWRNVPYTDGALTPDIRGSRRAQGSPTPILQ